jgi:DNA-binding MarR family transcriptional regulator
MEQTGREQTGREQTGREQTGREQTGREPTARADADTLLWGLRHAQQAFWADITAALALAGMPELRVRQMWVLKALAERASSPSELAARLAMSRQLATQIVDVLVRDGFVARAASDTDRRRVVLGLTDRGAQAVLVAGRASNRVLARIRRRLGDAGLAELIDALGAVR